MAKKWKCYITKSGMSQVLRSKEVNSCLKEIGDNIVSNAGEGYEATVTTLSNRCVLHVKATTPKAYNSNLKHNTLLKAMGGGQV